MNFEQFDQLLQKHAKNEDEVERDNLAGVFKVFHHCTPVLEIDFDSFTLEDVINAENDFYDNVHFTDTYYDVDDVTLLNNHPFCVARDFTNLMEAFNKAPKVKAKSRYNFI